VYGNGCDNTIIASWLNLQIAYTQSTQQDEKVVEMADDLFKSLVQRDTNFKEMYHSSLTDLEINKDEIAYVGYEGVDELKEEMEKIKINVIATHIMEMTRMLDNEKK
jgi:uncharacterized protein YecA (UPF0149 family)